MNSPLLVVLGISSTLLGLYILVLSLINIQEKPDFHVGCYLSNQTTHNAFLFRTRLNQLQSQGNQNRNFHQKIRNSQLVDPSLHRNSVELTRNVESYIRNLAIIKNYQESNMQFFTELSQSRQAFENCAAQLRQTIDIEDNRSLWDQYKKCFDQYQGLKDNIDDLYSKRNKFLNQIDRLLVFDPNSNKEFDMQAELKKIKSRYDEQNALNDKNKENYIIELKRLQHRNQTKSSQFDQNEREFNRSKLQYEICLKNLKQFRKCEDIANALRQYGYVQTVESLEDRIRSKREMLMKLRELVIQSREGGNENKAITQMYVKREKQLIQTIKLRLHMGYDEMKQCGCTEQQRKKLENDFQNSKIKLHLSKKQIKDLTYEIYLYEKKIKDTDRLRQRLIDQFREQTERLRNRQTSNMFSLQQALVILRENLTAVNQQLNNFSPKLIGLEFQCNQYKDKLATKLPETQKVAQCFAKKDFYDKLKSKAANILRKDDFSYLQAKQRIKKTIEGITYPQTSQILELKLVDKALQWQTQNTTQKQDDFTERAQESVSITSQQTQTIPQQTQTIKEDSQNDDVANQEEDTTVPQKEL